MHNSLMETRRAYYPHFPLRWSNAFFVNIDYIYIIIQYRTSWNFGQTSDHPQTPPKDVGP